MNPIRNPDETRNRLIQAAFDEIYAQGFQGMRVDVVLDRAGLRKGALYHHFGGKLELGYAVLDELIRGAIEQIWIRPVEEAEDPITGLKQAMAASAQHMPPERIKLGCPLNNLAQEMSPVDEGFRRRIADIYETWISGLERALERGKSGGYVAEQVDSHHAARFIVSALEGCIGVAKTAQSVELLENCGAELRRYLTALRPTSNNLKETDALARRSH